MGGFECATHIRRDGRRMDVIARTRHDVRCLEDYVLLSAAGVRTVRDGLRWHLIERVAGQYDWSSLLPMLRAAAASKTEVIWDLCHWGVPDGVDVFDVSFPGRFAAFARAAASVILQESGRGTRLQPNFYAPINEISFWSWAGGDVRYMGPLATGRGAELKRQLVRASVLAIHAIREVDPLARFVQPEPMINISAGTQRKTTQETAARHTEGQFEVWDMLAGRAAPELGGDESMLDLLGVNYYWNNQWVHERERTPLGHRKHRAVHVMLKEIHTRYQRPLLITETGAEAAAQTGWLGYIMAEVRQAQRMGVPVLGACLYPVMDYPGWDDGRHCHCGLLEVTSRWGARTLRPQMVEELRLQWLCMEAFAGAPMP